MAYCCSVEGRHGHEWAGSKPRNGRLLWHGEARMQGGVYMLGKHRALRLLPMRMQCSVEQLRGGPRTRWGLEAVQQ